MATLFRTDQSYVDPVFTADHEWLHLEARYNYENLHTGSVWVGYKFTAGKKLVLDVTPMIGGVFGRTTGIAPGSCRRGAEVPARADGKWATRSRPATLQVVLCSGSASQHGPGRLTW